MNMKRVILVTLAIMASSPGISEVNAATINASSCSAKDVQSSINSASNGDTVTVPAGDCTWSSVVNIGRKAITLQGAGIGKTNITNNIAPARGYLIEIDAQPGIMTRITGFSFLGSSERRMMHIACDKTSKTFRIDHNSFTSTASTVFIVNGGLCSGLIDHNDFAAPDNSEMIQIKGASPDSAIGWTDDISPGSPDAIYIEDNTFTNNGMYYDSRCPCWRWGANSALQSYYGARTVVRYNTFNDSQIDQHGTSGYIGARWWEIYENTLHITNDRTDQDKYMDIRAGSGVIFNNRKTGYFNTRGGTPPIVLREEDPGYPALYQVGRGKNQALDPAYMWGNDSMSNTANYWVDVVFSPAASGGAPVTIWPGTAAPGRVDSGPDSAVELGVKFRAHVSGAITGIRFYKASTNTGTHVGTLWTSTGTPLATATFTGETESGWQQVNFATPVAITANTVYVASYHTNAGHYSYDGNYFASAGADNPPLQALANGVSGSNGVYAYAVGSVFPDQTLIESRSSSIQLNRDYYLAAKPGYKPYTYPHPLASGKSALKSTSGPINFRIVPPVSK